VSECVCVSERAMNERREGGQIKTQNTGFENVSSLSYIENYASRGFVSE
jgi:hypothetical protein